MRLSSRFAGTERPFVVRRQSAAAKALFRPVAGFGALEVISPQKAVSALRSATALQNSPGANEGLPEFERRRLMRALTNDEAFAVKKAAGSSNRQQ
jgi:hypothetical protein